VYGRSAAGCVADAPQAFLGDEVEAAGGRVDPHGLAVAGTALVDEVDSPPDAHRGGDGFLGRADGRLPDQVQRAGEAGPEVVADVGNHQEVEAAAAEGGDVLPVVGLDTLQEVVGQVPAVAVEGVKACVVAGVGVGPEDAGAGPAGRQPAGFVDAAVGEGGDLTRCAVTDRRLGRGLRLILCGVCPGRSEQEGQGRKYGAEVSSGESHARAFKPAAPAAGYARMTVPASRRG